MPDWKPHLRARLSSLRMAPERRADVIEELSQHLDERHAELVRDGHSDAHAQRIAIDELQEPDGIAAQLAPLRQSRAPEPVTEGAPNASLLRDFWHDLRFAVRSLRTQPAFAAVAILTLALGIGANAAIFSLVDATLLRPLPIPEPDRVLVALGRTEASPRIPVSPLDLRDFNERNHSFERIAGMIGNVGGMVMTGADGTAETVSRQWVTAGIFDVLGVKPLVGRSFTDEDDRIERNAVAAVKAITAARIALQSRMPMGSVCKCIAVYPRPFWKERGFSGEAVSDRGPIRAVFDDSPHPGSKSGHGALIGFMLGDHLRQQGERDAALRRQDVLGAFARFFGDDALHPIDYIEKNWTAEPWSAGCYTGIMPPATLTRFGQALRAPIGRIHFAGTETATHWTGYMDGALESGGRAADEILARLAAR